MTLEVITHDEWVAVSNSDIESDQIAAVQELTQLFNDSYCIWLSNFFSREGFNLVRVFSFAETPKLSSYLWTLNVGHFMVKEYHDYKFPIKLLTRRGQQDPESTNLCFEICKATIDFYEVIFGQPYPFSKLDLVLCPMVRYTAMECAGCIVFTENMMGS